MRRALLLLAIPVWMGACTRDVTKRPADAPSLNPMPAAGCEAVLASEHESLLCGIADTPPEVSVGGNSPRDDGPRIASERHLDLRSVEGQSGFFVWRASLDGFLLLASDAPARIELREGDGPALVPELSYASDRCTAGHSVVIFGVRAGVDYQLSMADAPAGSLGVVLHEVDRPELVDRCEAPDAGDVGTRDGGGEDDGGEGDGGADGGVSDAPDAGICEPRLGSEVHTLACLNARNGPFVDIDLSAGELPRLDTLSTFRWTAPSGADPVSFRFRPISSGDYVLFAGVATRLELLAASGGVRSPLVAHDAEGCNEALSDVQTHALEAGVDYTVRVSIDEGPALFLLRNLHRFLPEDRWASDCVPDRDPPRDDLDGGLPDGGGPGGGDCSPLLGDALTGLACLSAERGPFESLSAHVDPSAATVNVDALSTFRLTLPEAGEGTVIFRPVADGEHAFFTSDGALAEVLTDTLELACSAAEHGVEACPSQLSDVSVYPLTAGERYRVRVISADAPLVSLTIRPLFLVADAERWARRCEDQPACEDDTDGGPADGADGGITDPPDGGSDGGPGDGGVPCELRVGDSVEESACITGRFGPFRSLGASSDPQVVPDSVTASFAWSVGLPALDDGYAGLVAYRPLASGAHAFYVDADALEILQPDGTSVHQLAQHEVLSCEAQLQAVYAAELVAAERYRLRLQSADAESANLVIRDIGTFDEAARWAEPVCE